MGRPTNHDLEGDPEYTEFTKFIEDSNKSKATAKSYKTTFRKLRDILGKNISDTAQDTCAQAIMASTDNINSAQALINIAIIVRQNKQMPVNELIEQRNVNKEEVTEMLKQANLFSDLPPLSVFDDYLEDLWNKHLYREYIINYLIRHHYVRNQDCIFDIVETKRETLETSWSQKEWWESEQLGHQCHPEMSSCRTEQCLIKKQHPRLGHKLAHCLILQPKADQI